jgi:hypothetical protein
MGPLAVLSSNTWLKFYIYSYDAPTDLNWLSEVDTGRGRFVVADSVAGTDAPTDTNSSSLTELDTFATLLTLGLAGVALLPLFNCIGLLNLTNANTL